MLTYQPPFLLIILLITLLINLRSLVIIVVYQLISHLSTSVLSYLSAYHYNLSAYQPPFFVSYQLIITTYQLINLRSFGYHIGYHVIIITYHAVYNLSTSVPFLSFFINLRSSKLF